ncbi:HNH endonuclease signature motif containing protein [Mycolicibacterium mengxianglii]|uniref:HNH endonuclease signature motif containing protein n=1 Tax=Mycolicibacterium mengxianglii TaxID=2736649 RepID=UPI0018D1362A|nr:HNH endonuclease signature motif containing protein [Mycolicibacterium mengxianglii]
MFDELPDSASRADLDDAAVVSAIKGWTRAVATAAAHRLAFIAELTSRRYDEDWDVSEEACDAWDSAASEVCAASGISQGRASKDMEVGAALCARLPKVAALFLAGQISELLVRRIVHRTSLMQDRGLLAELDAVIADRAVNWGALSQKKLDEAIDVWVDRYDPGALRHSRNQAQGREVGFGNNDSGTTEISGRLLGADAALVDRRLTLMAKGVCEDDPRTFKQRRADALGALGAGSTHLGCQCGSPNCPAAEDDGRASSVVVHIYAEQAAMAAEPDALKDGEGAVPDDEEADTPQNPSRATDPESSSTRAPAAVVPGFGIVPAPLLAALIAAGAKVRQVKAPAVDPENKYRISTALGEFVRARDLTCRFPNCDRPADFGDLDHTVAWVQGGPTHASNLKGYCRIHHLVKTFRSGWSDKQLPDGTVVITSPTGHTYTTKPGSALLFPAVNITSAPVTPDAPQAGGGGDRTVAMPKRKRSRAKERAYRIKAERARNDAHVAERNQPPPF